MDENRDEAGLASLLRAAGRRESPTPELTRQIRAVVHAEWREAVLERQRALRQRRVRVTAMAASVCAVAAAIGWIGISGSRLPLATVVRTTGVVGGAESLRTGATVTTGTDGRMAMAWRTGLSIRLDHDTQVDLEASDAIRLNQGAVYVDSGTGDPAPLRVLTPFGEVSHLGTQYQVRVSPEALLVSVREGRVAVVRGEGVTRGSAGEQLRIGSVGPVQRTNVGGDAEEWSWATQLATPFDIDQRSLTDFLAWVGRETGRTVVYESIEAQTVAAQVILRGSVAGLAPDPALDAVLATTSLRAERASGRLALTLR